MMNDDDFKREGSDPFADVVKETPPESLPDKKPEETEGSKPVEGDNTPDKELPFHEHPRWKAREEELENLRHEVIELKTLKEDKKENTTIPEWFKELFGENEKAWEKYSERESVREQEIEQKIISRQEETRVQSENEIKYWNKWVDDEIGRLEGEGKHFDKNKLIKTMLDYRPSDEKGNFDFNAGYKIYEALEMKEANPAKSEARKQLADTATKSSRSEPQKKDYMTSNELRHKSWGALLD